MSLLPLSNVMLIDVEHVVSPNQDIPKDQLDIFFRDIQAFIPEGKTWDDLTDKEQAEIKDKYRFDPMRPGMYGAITGFGKMVN